MTVVWEIEEADYSAVDDEEWLRVASALRRAGLTWGEPRRQGGRVEVQITTDPAVRFDLRIVQTKQRRHELEDECVCEAVVVLPSLPRSRADRDALLPLPLPRLAKTKRPLSFGYFGRDEAPAELESVLAAYLNTFGIDDDVRLTTFGVTSRIAEEAWARLIERRAEAPAASAPPLLTVRAHDAVQVDPIDVNLTVDTSSRLQLSLLTAAERGIAMVVPRIGGHRDYLDESAGAVVECRAALPSSHGVLRFSVVPDSLERQLWRVTQTVMASSVRRIDTGLMHRREPASIAEQLTAVIQARRSAADDRPSTELTAWVSTWNIKCGIASHVRNQLAAADVSRHLILAARTDEALGPDDDNVVRCWDASKESNRLGDALSEIDRRGVTSVVIHFNWGFFHAGDLSGFIKCLIERGVVVFIDLHSTIDPPTTERLSDLSPALRSCDRVLAHALTDVDRLLRIRVDDNVLLHPLGVLTWPLTSPHSRRAGPTPLLATFGYSFPNKGMLEFARAVALLKQRGLHVRALMLNAEHPSPSSVKTVAEVRAEIQLLRLEDDIDFRTDYFGDEQCVRLLSEADLIVNPYQHTSESASAAVRYCMAACRPVLVTPLEIFRDLGDAVFRSSDISVESLAEGIGATLAALAAGTPAAGAVAEAAASWLREHDVAVQASRLSRLATSIRRNRALVSPAN